MKLPRLKIQKKQRMMTEHKADKEAFVHALLSMNRLEASQIIAKAATSTRALQLLEQLIVPALDDIGNGWEQGDVALSQVYMSSRICEEIVDGFMPPTAPERIDQPTMAIAVLEDFHALGKRVVYSCLRAAGFELLDYGPGQQVEALIDKVKADQVRVLLISTLLLPSALKVKQLRKRLDENGLDVRLIVGGAPFRFDSKLWQEVGADAVGKTASDAVDIVRNLVKEMA